MKASLSAWLNELLLLLLLLLATSVHAQEWPHIALPAQVRSFDVAQQLTHNGVPMRLQGFLSSLPPDGLLALFRECMGQPLVESQLGQQRILGRAQGEFYLSVQVEPAGTGSRGVAAVTHLQAAQAATPSTRLQLQRWTERLPPGSRVISHLVSRDGSKLSLHLMFVNASSQESNEARLKELLQGEGLLPDQEASRAGAASATPAASDPTGHALFFKGPGKEAIATIHRDSFFGTTVVLNVITQLKGAE